MSETFEFCQRVRSAWDANTLVKLTLSDRDQAKASLKNLRVRPVELKEGRKLSVVECYTTREVTKNYVIEEALRLLGEAFEKQWFRVYLFTLEGDFQFRRERNGKVSVRRMRPSFQQMPSVQHDRVKVEHEALAAEPFLQRLGVVNAFGEARPGMAGKLRQVQRFSELLGHLLEEWGWKGERCLQVADMGAGKGYLTFALARAFQMRGIKAEVVGVEQRAELVEMGNRVAGEIGMGGLKFVQGTIGQWVPENGLDVLVALHACDTATDDALFQAIKANTGMVVTSPCCHQEVRPQLEKPDPLRSVLSHGILLERHAEILTDGLRALLLELSGYRARVFEFVEPEHSGKNLMLAAIRREGAGGRSENEVRNEIHKLLAVYGIRKQKLAVLLGEIEAK